MQVGTCHPGSFRALVEGHPCEQARMMVCESQAVCSKGRTVAVRLQAYGTILGTASHGTAEAAARVCVMAFLGPHTPRAIRYCCVPLHRDM